MSNVSMIDGHIDRPMTNYEKIKNMSVEEMAKEILVVKCLNLLPDPIWCALPLNMFYTNEKEAVESVIKWLESEIEENER